MTWKNEWEQFFNGHAPVYMNNEFTRNTIKEVDFVLEELKLAPGCSILDVGCGTGRHTVELARRGYKVTGVDISAGMLAVAERAAKEAGVKVELVRTDATNFKSAKQFDAAICLCEGAFGLLGSSDHPLEHEVAILRSIHNAVKKEARIIVTLLSAFKMIREYSQGDVESGKFDPVMMVEVHPIEWNTAEGKWDTTEGKKSVLVRERGYVPTELYMIFGEAGFQVEHIWGGTAGDWGRRRIKLDEFEIMVVARKHGRKDTRGFARALWKNLR
jgi:SAM-dependent methyltransferase